MIEKLSFTTVLASVIKTVQDGTQNALLRFRSEVIFLIRIIRRKSSARFRIHQKRCGKNVIKLSFMRLLMVQMALSLYSR